MEHEPNLADRHRMRKALRDLAQMLHETDMQLCKLKPEMRYARDLEILRLTLAQLRQTHAPLFKLIE